MKTLRCAIVDDEPLALNLMVGYVEKVPFLELVAKCSSAFQALEVLSTQKVDLLFLDIQMPGLTGLELCKTIPQGPRIIFTTAYSEYAIDGFRADAIDYLLKPFDFTEFLKAANKAYNLFRLSNQSSGSEITGTIMVKSESKLIRLAIKEIMYVESMGDYVKIFCFNTSNPIITQLTMKIVEEKLPSELFFRVHRSFIVNLEYIKTIERNRIVFGKTYIPISESAKSEFYKLLSEGNL